MKLALGLGIVAALAAPSGAAATSADYLAATSQRLTGPTISLKDSEPEVLNRVVLSGAIPVAAPNQWVTVTLKREGRPVFVRRVAADPATGRYRTRLRLKGCCEYVAQANHGSEPSDALAFEAAGPETLEDRSTTLMFNRLLRENGYHMGEVTAETDESTGLAIMALRKVLGMDRTEEYAPKLFTALLSGDAEFEPLHGDDDRHVEVDLSRQVMALVDDGEATHVFHVSTGAGGNPTGEFRFYSRGPGYNAKGMYYSVYYSGNYATHGYSSVPTYPASHGCVRNSIAYAPFVYDWISLGDTIYVYE